MSQDEQETTSTSVGNNVETTLKQVGGCTGKGWLPGQSGNPSGRPKVRMVDELLAELLQAKDSEESLAMALKLIEKAKAGDVRAAQLIAERTQGKPNQKVEVTGKDGGPIDSKIEIVLVRPNADGVS